MHEYLKIFGTNNQQDIGHFLIYERDLLIDLVKKKMKISENLSLKYYNGKYIFLEKDLNGKNEFIVLKGESLVDLLKEDK